MLHFRFCHSANETRKTVEISGKPEISMKNFNLYISYVLNHKFQIDLYALAMSLHLLMFGDYAKVEIKNERAGNNISDDKIQMIINNKF